MSARGADRWLVIACICALAALALMTWQVFDPSVWPVMIAMSLGQVLGTASFAAFGYVVFADFRARRREAGDALPRRSSRETPIANGEKPRT
jgi:hypothetical protein